MAQSVCGHPLWSWPPFSGISINLPLPKPRGGGGGMDRQTFSQGPRQLQGPSLVPIHPHIPATETFISLWEKQLALTLFIYLFILPVFDFIDKLDVFFLQALLFSFQNSQSFFSQSVGFGKIWLSKQIAFLESHN